MNPDPQHWQKNRCMVIRQRLFLTIGVYDPVPMFRTEFGFDQCKMDPNHGPKIENRSDEDPT